ncbi:hypothetical protein O6H91_21G071300 [Diphasiastrum complanatum]|uniref:Uncharacterized protein n=1 Tax=Diphasiastrum complanatum TaxID=34168 RepID=A0ACC2ALM5_DIPCM|nr:hypothetical protein O6H91_21G071300 [Diphasiastrum complanatum]
MQNSPKHPDFKHKRTLEGLWVDGWLNPPWVKEKMASMTLGHIQSGDGLRSRYGFNLKCAGMRLPHVILFLALSKLTLVHISLSSLYESCRLSKLCEEGRLKEALHMLKLMVQKTTKPPIRAYALAEGKQVHALIVQSVLDSNIFLANTLVHMYSKCGSVLHAHKVFSNMPQHDVYSWTAIISAYADSGEVEEAINLFQQMQETGLAPDKVLLAGLEQGRQLHSDIIKRGFQSDVIVGSTLDARELFDNMSERNVNGLGKEALALYEQMKQEGMQPNHVTLAALEQGKQLHSEVIKRGFQSDVVVCSTLDARELFDNLSERDVNGLGKEALALYEQMQREGKKPDEVTYTSVLSACAHSGLVDQGRYVFDSMCKNHGVTPTKEHYACMLFVNKMPIQPDNVGHVEIGRRAFDHVVKLEPKNAAPYVLLSKIYAAAGRKEAGVKKVPGRSWIEIDNQLHAFVVGDATHPQSKEIQAELDRLVGLMKKAGYKPNLSFVLEDVEDEEKENALCGHSEKQAIAFGLINTPFGTPIRIKKSLRVCGDCHNATKIISKIVGRDISVMDADRYHHFKDGFCSCGDYW